MSPTLERLKPEIDRLSDEEREELADYLFASGEAACESEEEIRKHWEAEIEARIEEFRSGRDPGIPGEVVMAEMREKYNL